LPSFDGRPSGDSPLIDFESGTPSACKSIDRIHVRI
jgi:hypothetical protein